MVERLLIHDGLIQTCDSRFTQYDRASLLVEGDRIVAIGHADEFARSQADEVIDARDMLVLPGLINLHAHSGLIRGTAEDLSLWEWLRKYIDPKHRVLTAEDAYAAARLCYAEMLRAGITTVLDMYRFMHRCADAAKELGIRAILAPYVADQPEYDYFESPQANYELLRSRHGDGNGRIHVWLGMEHLTYCTEETFRRGVEYAQRYGVGIHTHGEEAQSMHARICREYGKRPIEVFDSYGILRPKTVLAHCVWLDPEEIRLLSQRGAAVAHCPVSNMKLASGVCPVPALLDAGVTVGLGSDGVKENNRLDLFQEMKVASLLQKVHNLDASKLPAQMAVRMATLSGAQALGLEKEVGSLEPGKKADIVLVDLQQPHLTPLFTDEFGNVIPHLVYAMHAGDVHTVIVDGRIVVRARHLLLAEEAEIRANAQRHATELVKRRKAYVPSD